MKVVVSDRDRRVVLGPHILNLKAGDNKVPAELADQLVDLPGLKLKRAKAESPAESKSS